MKPESLEQLVGSGNVKVVEEQWLALLEDPAAALATIGQYDGVLSKLVETGNREQAEQFAWAAVESLASVHPAADVVPVAGKFLLALGDKSELRGEACKLYRTAFPEQDALDDLLTEAGLEQGRPVRRALRTLDVCLELSEGDFVAARDDDGAARIERIDLPDWTFTLDLGGRTKELGAVYLADGYHKVGRAHFNVMRRFFPDELAERVRKAPATIIIELCRQSGNTLDSDDLEYTLVPAVIAPEKWKKWFTSARTALRKDAHVKLEGRGPWTIQYQEAAVDPEAEFRALFDSKRTPEARFAALEAYLRDCKTRGVEVAAPAVQTGYDWFITRAREHTAKRRSDADRYWLFARRIEQLATVPTPAPEVLERIADVKDLLATVRKLKDDAQIECFCLALIEARPDTWQAELRALLQPARRGALLGEQPDGAGRLPALHRHLVRPGPPVPAQSARCSTGGSGSAWTTSSGCSPTGTRFWWATCGRRSRRASPQIGTFRPWPRAAVRCSPPGTESTPPTAREPLSSRFSTLS